MFNTDLRPSAPEYGSVNMRGWMYLGAVAIGLVLMSLGDFPDGPEADAPMSAPAAGDGRTLAAPTAPAPQTETAPAVAPEVAIGPALAGVAAVPAALHFSAKAAEPSGAPARRTLTLKP